MQGFALVQLIGANFFFSFYIFVINISSVVTLRDF